MKTVLNLKPIGVLLAILLQLFALSGLALQVQLLESDETTAVSRVKLMLSARKTIDGLYFIFGKDESALRGLALARKAAIEHGVKTRLIIDGMFNAIPPAMIRHLSDLGIQIRVYNRFKVSQIFTGKFLHRMHEKGVCVDGQVTHLGGRNAESAYFGKDSVRPNYVDRDVAITSEKFCDQFTEYFDELWTNADLVSEVDTSKVKSADVLEASRTLQRVEESLLKDYADPRWAEIEKTIPTFEVEKEPLLIRKTKDKSVALKLTEIVSTATKSVTIETPYLVLTPEMLELMIQEIGDDQIFWRILTNSPYSSDGVIAAAAYINDRPELARAMLELWEFKGPRTLHSKTAVIDMLKTIVGTFNMDPRSQNLNGEWAVLIESEELAKAVSATMQKNIENAKLAAQNGQVFKDNVKEISKPRGWKRKLVYHCARHLARIPFVKSQI